MKTLTMKQKEKASPKTDGAFLRIRQSRHIALYLFRRRFLQETTKLEENKVVISPLRGRGPAISPARTRIFLEETKVGLLVE